MNNIPISYTLPKSTHKVLLIPSKGFQKFWPRKKSSQIKNPENLSIFGQIGRVTRLEFPILTTNTIFRNLKSMRVQWASSFSNLRTSKIWVCKGPPFELSICQISVKLSTLHHRKPVYQNFSVNIDPEEHKKHHGNSAHFRWHLPQNTAGL